ncbi:MAG: glycoside hydrolase family 125 protein [Pyrinomonadaceae bacterium]
MLRRTFIKTGSAAAVLGLSPRPGSAQRSFISRRPAIAARKLTSPAVEEKIGEITGRLKDKELAWLFENCYPNTLDTTVSTSSRDGKPDSFVITGDIDALWLRDSTAQVTPYLPLAKEDEKLRVMIRGLIHRHAYSILLDPYANAFMHDPNKVGWESDRPKYKPGIHERKWEVDSLCYAIRLSHQYWKTTGDASPFDAEWQRAMKLVVSTFQTEQLKSGPSPYRFIRQTTAMFDAPPFEGEGYPLKPCGLIRSAFRPSDDSTIFGFLIPSNMFAVVELQHLAEMARSVMRDDVFFRECLAFASEIRAAIMRYAVAHHTTFGKVFAYEVDGFGNRLFMDDANVPNLLAIPYLGFMAANDPIVANTRRFVLSDANPYFASGRVASGIGSPHTGRRSIWPIGLTMQALTSTSEQEIAKCISTIKRTHAGTGFMHESFDPDDPAKFTRKWFAWANTLFGELIVKIADERPKLLDRNY